MMAPETGSEAFSDSEEDFFRSAVEDHALQSERPVTLEAEELVEEPNARMSLWSAEREARRARFVRRVTSTLAALGLLTLVGLARHALSSESFEPNAKSSERTLSHSGVPTAATANVPVNAASPAAENEPNTAAARDIAAASSLERADVTASVSMSTCDGAAPLEPGTASSPPKEPSTAPHGAALARAPARPTPITKSALLSASRAPHPARNDTRKTL
jgi:hypothetical protein